MYTDLLIQVPSWDDVERNLERRFSELNQSVSHGLQGVHAGWEGFTRRVSDGASSAYGAIGGRRINCVRHAMALSYPIMHMNLTRKWASINIAEILPVLLKLAKEAVMVVGGSVMTGAAVGGVVGSGAFGVGALPGAAIGGGIGLEVGSWILASMGLYSLTCYFLENLWPSLSAAYEGLTTAWQAYDGLKPEGLDPSGASAAMVQERTERAARQLARGQEQLVVLLLMAIATYLYRGEIKSGVINRLDSVAARSAKLQSEISNKELSNWLARNEQRMLAQPELQMKAREPLMTEPMQQLRALGSKPTHQIEPVVLARVNGGRAPYSELNGAIGEARGWYRALESGHLPISGPGKASTPGADYITFDPATRSVIVWDAKYRAPGGRYPSALPVAKLRAWQTEITNSVRNMPEGPIKVLAENALKAGRVEGRIFKWP